MINGLNLNYDFISQRVACAPSDGIITSAYVVCRPRSNVNYDYYTYLFKAILRNLGFEVTNEIFAENSKYFRNSLVRANYTNMQYGITETTEYLERFFRNLLMGEQNELKNRYMIVGTKWEENKKEDSTATQESTQETNKSTQESTQETNKSTQEMILEEIRKHPFTTREQLAKVIGITPDGIKKQLDKMKKAKRIKHVGPTKGGHWEIITE